MDKRKKGVPLPLGVTIEEEGINFAVELPEDREISLLLYKKGNKRLKVDREIFFPKENRQGKIAYLYVEDLNPEEYEYNFCCGGKVFQDPYARRIYGKEKWGRSAKEVRCGFLTEDFPWEGDKPLDIPYEDSIIYRMHVRGFTRHHSSNVQAKGTYTGIIEKIPYLKELGITLVELMPIHEFEELIVPEYPVYMVGTQKLEDAAIINYWGFTEGFYFSPKTAYAKDKDVCWELKQLIKELHKNGIEIGIELYFAQGTKSYMILDCLKYWVMEYHVDALHVNADVAPMTLIAQDPSLAGIKIFGNQWDTNHIYGKKKPFHRKNLGEYNDGFLVDIRKFLKSDEDQINSFIYRFTRNPEDIGVVNYISNHDSFTLADMVTYERRCNEANGEGNRDGNPYNFTWNCGVEGETKRKKVLEKRLKQMKNALILLFMSQGTPMLLAGDEIGRTKKGNNNAYCQDNEISWINWNLQKKNASLFEFVKELIRFRKEHSILHLPKPLKMMDYGAMGCPDLSFHSAKAWYPELDGYSRYIGLMFCGAYTKQYGKDPDDMLYLACNLHWEEHDFALPNLPKGKHWFLAITTDIQAEKDFYKTGEELLLEDQKNIHLSQRTVVVLIGK